MDTNCCIFTGRLTKDAELKKLPSGLSIVNFSLGFSEPKKSKTIEGQHEYYSNYINCSIFGNYGEALFPMLKKGQEITVTTRLHQNRWESNGEKRQSYDFIVNNAILQRPPKKANPQNAQTSQSQVPSFSNEFEPQELNSNGQDIY